MNPRQIKPHRGKEEELFDAYVDALRAGWRQPAKPALLDALAAGLSAHWRNRYGESLLEASARLGSLDSCLLLLELGADAFEPTLCVDERGNFARLRAFEAFIAHELPDALLAAAGAIGAEALPAEHARWRELARRTHPQLRLWRAGSGWMHLAAAACAPESLSALAGLGISAHELDDSGSGPLMPCAKSRRKDPRCARELMLLGANPWEPNHEGEAPADFMPPEWASLRALAEADLIERGCPEREQRESWREKSMSL